ncbi:CCDC90 family protein [Klebsiella pneumoniae]|nr:CCDC90 family protein [Klebsiella pneumoniae]
MDESSKLFSIGVEIESPEGYYTPDFVKPASPKDKQDSHMSDLNRNEIQALLKANKAEVDAVASKMQADMAKWRETMALDMKEIKGLISTQHEKINGRLDMQSTKIESALDSQSKKIDAALSIQEAKIEGKLTEVKLDIIKWALGLPALAFVLYKIYGALTGTP